MKETNNDPALPIRGEEEATKEMDKAVKYLYLELPSVIADDVSKKWEAVKYAQQFAATPQGQEAKEIERLRLIADLISRIYYYGSFKPETNNERKLEELLIESGLWPTTEDEIISRKPIITKR